MLEKLALALLLLLTGYHPMASADWIQLTQSELVETSNLIVVGELLGAQEISLGATTYRIGVIQIEEVVRGSPSGQGIALLRMQLASAGGLRPSVETGFGIGSRGLWYLLQADDGLYSAGHPQRFVPINEAGETLKVLRGR